MNRKENDLMMNIVANPDFSMSDFATVGLDINNTSLETPDIYKNNSTIRDYFTDEEGKFKEKDFIDTYQSALIGYNNMAQEEFNKVLEEQISFHRDNIWAPLEKRRQGPDFKMLETPNPDRITTSLIKLGEVGPRTKTMDEIAQGQKVLLNPLGVENGEKPQWGEAPEDDFTGYFFDTLVLAQYDEDVIDQNTGEIIHAKGSPKLNEDGTYYYERLDGRNIYDKKVLNKMNVLTKEGSYWNQYDFFDSDDIKKSTGGAVMRNLALVGPMFIPYVGPTLIGLNVATSLVGLFGTFGKMISGSDSPTLSNMEGWAKSISQQGNVSEYASKNTWCWENFINLAGDVAKQLKEQRFIFEKMPALFTGKYVGSKSSYNKYLDDLIEKHRKINTAKVKELSKINQTETLEASAILNSTKYLTRSAQEDLDAFMKTYNKIGSVLGRGYMTGIVVQDTYGEAINAGATDIEATMLTLGYAAAEYALLSSDIGKWIMPESSADKFKFDAIINTATQQAKKLSLGQSIKALDKTSKKQYIKDLFNLGKNAAKEAHAKYASTGKGVMGATMAAAAAEGAEEFSEEILADFAKGCYNVTEWLSGDNTRLNSFGFSWSGGSRSWSAKDLVDRYGMSLVGGAFGGGIANLGNNYRMGKTFSNMSTEQAIQELVYIGRNEGFDNFRKHLNKSTVGDKNSSTRIIENNGSRAFAPGTATDNQDLAIKKAFHKQLDLIESILNAEGAAISDSSFLAKHTDILKDLRYDALHSSVLAGRYLQEFNKDLSELVRIKDAMNTISNQNIDTNNSGTVEDSEQRNAKNTQESDELKKLEEEYKKVSERVQAFVTGKNAADFIADTLWDMSAAIKEVTQETLPTFVKTVYGKEYNKLTEEEKQQALIKYRNYKIETADDKVNHARIYREVAKKSSSAIKQSEEYYANTNQHIKDLTRNISELFENFKLYKQGTPEEQLEIAKIINSIRILSETSLKSLSPKIWDTVVENYNNKLQSIDQELKDGIIDQDTANQQKEEAFTEYKKDLYSYVENIVDNQIEDIKKSGYINPEILNNISKLVDFLTAVYNDNSYKYRQLAEQDWKQSDFYSNIADEEDMKSAELMRRLNELKELSYTPVVKSLNSFLISIGENPLNITELLNRVNSIIKDNTKDLGMFNLDNELLLSIENALGQLSMYEMAILGARTDHADLRDLYGYNRTLNEVAKKLGNESDLAEIDSEYADFLVQDVRVLKNKLSYARQLYTITSGQKLSTHNRVAIKKDLLIFKQLKRLIDIEDPNDPLKNWEGFGELVAIINSSSTLQGLFNNNKPIEYSPELKDKVEKERLAIEDALYKFFNLPSNQSKINDPQQLSQLIRRFDLYTDSNEILDENLDEIDGPSMVWYLASRAGLKASDFYGECKTLLESSNIALVPSQELAIYNTYASIINGNIMSAFQKAYKYTILQDWKNKLPQQRADVLRRLGKNDTEVSIMSAEEFVDYLPLILNIPIFQNISLIEGIPGSGKTKAVVQFVVELLRQNPNAKNLLDNVALIHGSDEIKDGKEDSKNGNNLFKSLNIGGTVYVREKFCEKIAPKYAAWAIDAEGNYNINDSDYEITKEGDIISKLGISEENPPSLVIIDEISKFNRLELELIDRYARKHGITVIAAGDYDQNSAEGRIDIKINKHNPKLNLIGHRNHFPRSIKLGVSMRTDNSIKSFNQILMQGVLHKDVENISFQYYEDATGLYGDRVLINDSTNLILQEIDKLINTSSEPIGYIYNNPNSPLYKILSTDSKYVGKIDFKFGGTAQGNEAQYYIIEHSGNIKDHNSKKELYTGITRASQGSLVIVPQNTPIFSDKKNNKVDSPLGEQAIKNYNKSRKKFLDENIKDNVHPEYQARTKEDVNVYQSKPTPRGLQPGINPSNQGGQASNQPGPNNPSNQPSNPPSNAPSNQPNTPPSAQNQPGNNQPSNNPSNPSNQPSNQPPAYNAQQKAVIDRVGAIQYWVLPRLLDIIRKRGYVVNPFMDEVGALADQVLNNPSDKTLFHNLISKVKDIALQLNAVIDYHADDMPVFDIKDFGENYYIKNNEPSAPILVYENDVIVGRFVPTVDGHEFIREDSEESTEEPEEEPIIPENTPILRVTDEELDFDSIDFDNNYVVVHQTMVDIFDAIESEGLYVRNGLNGTANIVNKEGLQRIIEDQKTGHGHRLTTGIVVMQFPKQLFPNRLYDLDDISIRLEELYGPSALTMVPTNFITHFIESIPYENNSEPEAEEDSDDQPFVDDVKNEEEYKKELIEENNPKSDPFDLVEHHIKFYTFNTLETGLVFDANGNIISDKAWIDSRIDGANGLIKIDRLQGNNSLQSEREYLERIAYIRSVLLNNVEKSDIIEGLKYLGIDNLFVNFAIKTSPVITDSTKQDPNKHYVAQNPDKYGKDSREKVYYHHSLGSNADDVIPHTVVALIGNPELGEILEIPLLSMSSPLTLAQIENLIVNEHGISKVPRYPELANIIAANRDESGNYTIEKHDVLRLMYGECVRIENDPTVDASKKALHTNMKNMLELYLYTYNGLFRINDPNNPADPYRDWTPNKALKNEGSSAIIEAGSKYDPVSGLITDYDAIADSNWLTVQQLSESVSINVSRKIYSARNSYYDGVKVCNAGHSFVLISFDKDIVDDSMMIDYYISHLKGEPGYELPKVELRYILPPKTTLQEYIENLNSRFYKGEKDVIIGTLYTPHKILQILFQNPEFMRMVNRKFPSSGTSKGVVQYVQEALNEIKRRDNPEDPSELINYLKTPVRFTTDESVTPISLVWQLRTFLIECMQKQESVAQLISTESELDTNMLQKVQDILNANHLNIYHRALIDKNSVEIGPFLTVVQDDNYRINRQPCKIHGKIDTYVFDGDFTEVIKKSVDKIIDKELPNGVQIKQSKDDYLGPRKTSRKRKTSQNVEGTKPANNSDNQPHPLNNFIIALENLYKVLGRKLGPKEQGLIQFLKTGKQLDDLKIPDEIIDQINYKLMDFVDNAKDASNIANDMIQIVLDTINKQDLDFLVFYKEGKFIKTDSNPVLKRFKSFKDEDIPFFTLDIDGASMVVTTDNGINEYYMTYNSNDGILEIVPIFESQPQPVPFIETEQEFELFKTVQKEIFDKYSEVLSFDFTLQDILKSESFEVFTQQKSDWIVIGKERINGLQKLLGDNSISDNAKQFIQTIINFEKMKETELNEDPDACITPIRIRVNE